MFETSVIDGLQLKQGKIEVLDQEKTVVVEVLTTRRNSGAGRALVKTTAEWDALGEKILCKGTLIVYSDYLNQTDAGGRTYNVPGMKVGDGETAIKDLPFMAASTVGEFLTEDEAVEILGEYVPEPGTVPYLSEDEAIKILDGTLNEQEETAENEEDDEDYLSDDEALRILNDEGDDDNE